MAETVTIRAALVRMGFSKDAAGVVVDDQGLNELTEFRILTDNEVENLCRVIQKPGGADDGHVVPLRAENNLKLACFYLKYKHMTSRTVPVADITLDNVRSLRDFKKWTEEHQAPEQGKMEFSHKTNWPDTIEAMEEHLKSVLGRDGITLAWITRQERQVKPAGEDPTSNYQTRQEELIMRAPHLERVNQVEQQTASYNADNEAVWEIIAQWTRTTECWTYVRPAQRTRDGRLAFKNLKEHYLGPNNVDTQSNTAEHTLQTTTYQGEQRRWNFERYSKLHKDQHAILEGLTEHGYSGIDARSKVRYLMDGIKTSILDPVTTNIIATPALRTDFNACVGLYKEFLAQKGEGKPKERGARIASLKTAEKNSQTSYDQVKPDLSVKDRYYNKSEYQKLTLAQKKGLKEKRKGRKGDLPKRK